MTWGPPRVGRGECLAGACDRCRVATAGAEHVLVFAEEFGVVTAHVCPACGEVDFALEALRR